MKGYPSKFTPLLIGNCLLLLLSGLLLLPTTLAMRWDKSIGWRLGSDARIATSACHALLAMTTLFFLGSLWSIHMRSGWRQRQQRGSGSLLVGSAVLLTVTSIGIYYLADERLSNLAALIHVTIGVFVTCAFVWHYWQRHSTKQVVKGVHEYHKVIR